MTTPAENVTAIPAQNIEDNEEETTLEDPQQPGAENMDLPATGNQDTPPTNEPQSTTGQNKNHLLLRNIVDQVETETHHQDLIIGDLETQSQTPHTSETPLIFQKKCFRVVLLTKTEDQT